MKSINKMGSKIPDSLKSEVKSLNRMKGTMDFDQEQNNFKKAIFDHLANMEK